MFFKGLIHTAFNLFNESSLEKVLKDYNEEMKEIKSGLLIHFLERGLMLNQIESHIDMVLFNIFNNFFFLNKFHNFKE